MRLTIGPSGEVTIDTDDPQQVIAVVKGLRNGSAPTKPAKGKKKLRAELESYDEPLSAQLVDAWNWLVANDNEAGSNSEEMAAGLGINPHTAVYRIAQLVKKDLAHKVKPGRYRAGTSR